ncbi:hypothetical protein L3X38_026298 [Prunus dulcis]|uniref:Uncharacterized protein n=1 Tax=Prunus dulcis TaxID=3755 RepID=A0AAD4UP73_PRUDU|nr:hypothetical protein L3X38_026298 [Prunus dulcis]
MLITTYVCLFSNAELLVTLHDNMPSHKQFSFAGGDLATDQHLDNVVKTSFMIRQSFIIKFLSVGVSY